MEQRTHPRSWLDRQSPIRENSTMVGYATFGTNDLPKAIAFYDELLGEFGGKQLMNLGRLVLYGNGSGAMFGICEPFDKQPASTGNGSMIALNMESQENVQKIHAKAVGLGATSEGDPGERMPGFYGAYFRDADGNKFCAFCMGG
jgi:catechol 2,3-dioxygenase-like lactoylglutathione lyase family enzyme